MKKQFGKTTYRTTVPLLTLIAGGLLMAPVQAQTNLITNGSFESGVYTPWDVYMPGGNGITGNSYGNTPPSDGSKQLIFNSGDTAPQAYLQQSFATVVGQKYTVQLDYAVINGTQSLWVDFTGNSRQTVTASGPFNHKTFSCTFTATSTTSTLRISDATTNSTGGSDSWLDNVRVSAVAPPANTPPVVSNQSVILAEDSSKTITISATDADGDALFFNVVSGPAHGTLDKTSGAIPASGLNLLYTPSANYNGTDSFTYTVSDRGGLYFSGTGHYYEYVSAPDISWDAAQAAASSKKLFGQTGYLATITSQVENQFVSGKLQGQGWLGGSDEAQEDAWRWVTGPEGAEDSGKGRLFWNGKANGRPVAGQYTNWNSGEPNGFAVEEDYLMTIGTGANVPWNDYPKSANNPGAPHFIQGYVIEYGGIPGEVVTIPTATVSINITPVNDAPVASNGSLAINEDTPGSGTLKATDVDGDAITYSKATDPSNGSVVVNADGTFTYSPKADFNGSDSFTFRASNGPGTAFTQATVTITVAAVNDAPIAAAQSVTTDEDKALSGAVSATDVDSTNLSYGIVSAPINGTLVLNSNGTFTYTPKANYNGPDSFTFRATDVFGTASFSNIATVSITVAAVDDAPVVAPQTETLNEDSSKTIVLEASDADGDALVFNIVTPPTHGTLDKSNGAFVNGKASLIYTPEANYNGPDSFTYSVSDKGGLYFNGTRHYYEYVKSNGITWDEAKDAAAARKLFGQSGYLATITFAGENQFISTKVADFAWLGGSDAGSEGTWKWLTGPEANNIFWKNGVTPAGAYSNWAPGEPNNGLGQEHSLMIYGAGLNNTWNDLRGFVHEVPGYIVEYGGLPGEASTIPTATVSVNVTPVNDVPVATNGTLATNEDTTGSGTLQVTDVDGDNLRYSKASDPAHGSVEVNPDGSYTYTPTANYNGPDSFTFQVNDGTIDSNVATVNINVKSVNDAPVAADQSATNDEDSAVSGTLSASDVEGDALTYSKVSGPTHGAVEVNAGGSFTYTPKANFNGTDSFTFKANDGTADSDIATVNITVKSLNDAPVADEQSVETDEDSSKAITISGSDVDGDDLTYAVIDGPSHGTLSGSGANLTYSPAANYNGPDSFTFKTNDGTSDSNEAKVSLTVKSINDAPVADAQLVTTAEDTDQAITLGGSDLDDDTLKFIVVDGPSHGTLSGQGASLTYSPDTNYNGPDSFTFKANDGTVDSKVAMVSITVSAVNDAPVAHGDAYNVNEDNTLTVPSHGVLGNDTDVDNISLLALVVTEPSHGTLTIDKDGSFTYKPNADFNGSDSFTYKANDGNADSEVATVNITVDAVNDAPVATSREVTTEEDTALDGSLSATDVDGDTLSYSKVAGPTHGSVTVNTDGSYTYTPNANYNGSDSFTFKAKDGSGDSNVATINITVKSVNDAPVVSGQSVNTTEDTAKEITLTGSDVDGDTLKFVVVDGPAHGTLSGSGDKLTYKPNADYNGSDSFTYKANDDSASSNTATVNIEISAVNDAPMASNSAVTTDEDTALNGTLKVNDVDGDALIYSTVNGPSYGSLTVKADGSYTYTPAANYNGPDSFTFKAKDGSVDSNVATVNITVKSVNDAPVAANDSAATSSVTLVGGNVLTNDTDIDGDKLTAVGVTPPAHGIANLNADGSFTYTPAVGFTGTDSFTYVANDGTADSNVATVTIKVTQPATTLDDKVTGGGTVTNKVGGYASFNLNPQSNATDGTIKGSLDYSDSQASLFVRSTSITGLVIKGTQARIFGKATINGAGSYDFVVDVTDNGEPGSSDTYSIRLSNGYTNGPKKISSGNIQIHK